MMFINQIMWIKIALYVLYNRKASILKMWHVNCYHISSTLQKAMSYRSNFEKYEFIYYIYKQYWSMSLVWKPVQRTWLEVKYAGQPFTCRIFQATASYKLSNIIHVVIIYCKYKILTCLYKALKLKNFLKFYRCYLNKIALFCAWPSYLSQWVNKCPRGLKCDEYYVISIFATSNRKGSTEG